MILFAILFNIASSFELDGMEYEIAGESVILVKSKCPNIEKKLVIPQSVTYNNKKYNLIAIGPEAFSFCDNYTGDLNIPNGVEAIGNEAFYGCSGLDGTLTIPETVISIGSFAFIQCSSLVGNLVLPKGLTEIKESTFQFCSSFTGSLTIPNGVISIENGAFRGCSGFEGTLTIPDTVTNIGTESFLDCTGFTCHLTLPKGLTEIQDSAFQHCNNLYGNLAIPEGVKSIGFEAFYGCFGFNGTITIPDTVTSIGSGAFLECSGLTGTLKLPTGITEIKDSIFQCCYNLKGDLTIPNGTVLIGFGAFRNCFGFDGMLTIPDTVTYIVSEAFLFCSGLKGQLKIPKKLTEIQDSVFKCCSKLTGDLTIPDSVTSIGFDAFRNCTGFNGKLTIPKTVTSIGSFAFDKCEGLNGELKLPEGLTEIQEGTFQYCSSFVGNLIIPNKVTSIGFNAFSDCSGFNGYLLIGENLASLSDGAFNNTRFYSVSFLGKADITNCSANGGITTDVIYVQNSYTGNSFCGISIDKNPLPTTPPTPSRSPSPVTSSCPPGCYCVGSNSVCSDVPQEPSVRVSLEKECKECVNKNSETGMVTIATEKLSDSKDKLYDTIVGNDYIVATIRNEKENIQLTATEDRNDNKLVLVLKEKTKIDFVVQGGNVPLAIDSSNDAKLSLKAGPSTVTIIPLESITKESIELENVIAIGNSKTYSESGIIIKPLHSVNIKEIDFYNTNPKFEVQNDSLISVTVKKVNVQANSKSILTGITVNGELNFEQNSHIRLTKVNIENANLKINIDEPQIKNSYINFGEIVTQVPLSIKIHKKKSEATLQEEQEIINVISENSNIFSLNTCNQWASKVTSDQNGYGVCESIGNNNVLRAYLNQPQNTDNNNENNDVNDDGGSSSSNGGDKKSQSNVKTLGNIQLETVYLGTSPNIIVNLKFVVSLMHKAREILGHLIPSPEIIHSAIWIGPKDAKDDCKGAIFMYGRYWNKLNLSTYLFENGAKAYVMTLGEFKKKYHSIDPIKLNPKRKLNLFEFIEEIKMSGKWTAKDYNWPTKNCQHFTSKLIDILQASRDSPKNDDWMDLPKTILKSLEKNEKKKLEKLNE